MPELNIHTKEITILHVKMCVCSVQHDYQYIDRDQFYASNFKCYNKLLHVMPLEHKRFTAAMKTRNNHNCVRAAI